MENIEIVRMSDFYKTSRNPFALYFLFLVQYISTHRVVIARKTNIQKKLLQGVLAFAALLIPDIEDAFQNCCKIVMDMKV